MDPASCVKKEGLWMLHNGLTPLADAYRSSAMVICSKDAGTARHGGESHPDPPVEERKKTVTPREVAATVGRGAHLQQERQQDARVITA